jgi:hypothetical protein
MNRAIIILAVVIIVLVGGFFILNNYIYQEKQEPNPVLQTGYKDIAYTINGKAFDLENGVVEADGVKTAYFGNEAEGDLSEDGVTDIAFILTQEKATSTSYYLVAAIQTEGGYRGTSAAYLGEGITPVATVAELGGVSVTYTKQNTASATSTPDEVSKFFVVSNGELVESDL